MEKYLAIDKTIVAMFNGASKKTSTAIIHSVGGAPLKLESASTTHGGFDNDPKTLNSTLRIIRGTDQLHKRLEHTE